MNNLSGSEASAQTLWSDISSWLEWWLSKPRLSHENQKVLDKYYKSYKQSFPKYVRKYYSRQTEELMQLIQSFKKPRVLEVGCGCGTESLWFAIHGASVVGVDLADDRLAVARERQEYLNKNLPVEIEAEFEKSSLFDLGYNQEFDLIWMEQAFHHVEPRNLVPEKLFKLLQPGGYVVISEANAWNPLLQYQLFRIRGLRTIREYTDSDGNTHMYGDERIATPGMIAKLFTHDGQFKLESIKYFRTLPKFDSMDNFSWLDHIVPHWFAPAFTHFNIVFSKNDE